MLNVCAVPKECPSRALLGFCLALALSPAPPASAWAQRPSEAEIRRRLQQNPQLGDIVRQRIRESGLTAEQLRSRLEASGYSPTLLDAYLAGEGEPVPQPSVETLDALAALGVGPLPIEGLEPVPRGAGFTPVPTGAAGPAALGLFGAEVFRRSTTQFQPLLTGPVPVTYRLGPGDVMVLVLTGDVELVRTLEVTREGFIVIPQVGQLFVNHLTMEQLRQLLRRELSRSYSGIPRGTTHFDVSIARLRTNQVFVIGEVVQPGAYQLASVATVLNALYAAGGPTDRGNFRSIAVRRGRDTVATLDLYRYLLRGDTEHDVVLEQGDVVFVPVQGIRASITGAVVRPAIYEIASGETLADLVDAAGGFLSEAALWQVTVHRILPAESRGQTVMARVALNVPLTTPVVASDGASAAVPQPRTTRSLAIPGLPLEDGDSVVVDAVPSLANSYFVRIAGMVQKPGSFPWSEGMTLRDLVRLAGGVRVGALLSDAEIARLPADRSQGQLAITVRVPLDSTYLFERDSLGRFLGPPGLAFSPGGAPDVELAPYDNVLILRQPEFDLQRTVTIVGEVRFPGAYALTRKDERLSDLVTRAGGLLPTAYADGARFVREVDQAGRVDLDLPAALAARGSAADLILQPGDSVEIPEYLPTVRVSGAVNVPSSVLWKEGQGLDYYISSAGGYKRTAEKGRVSVRYANGSARTKSKFLFFSSSPAPGPGSTVFVPERPPGEKGIDWTVLAGSIAQILVATVAIIAIANP